ncbi:MAG TPA: thioredoxin domain-containing protein [Terriglobales bacterium]|nr:thioredoxin domain-containing protein [Terriglobales bacterium]
MKVQYALMALGLSTFLGALSIPAVGQTNSSVVAEIDGQKVTVDELEQKEAGKLLQAKYKYYLAERDALEQLINDDLLELQAKKEGITVDELLKHHITSNIPEPTEDQLRFYYEGVQTDESYESARPHIIDTVHSLRAKKAKDAYLADLRSQYGVVVELSQPSAQVDVADAPRLGSEKAPVQIIEFADYECPYCQKVSPDLVKLRDQFGNQVSLVYKDFPLPMHPLAAKAAEAARCAGEQGKFWEYHDALFQTKRLQASDLKEQAKTLKLDTAKFDQCLDSGVEAAVVKKDSQEGLRLGLQGTPSFFINGHFMSGAIGYSKLRETVMEELGATSGTRKQSVALVPSKSDGKQ